MRRLSVVMALLWQALAASAQTGADALIRAYDFDKAAVVALKDLNRLKQSGLPFAAEAQALRRAGLGRTMLKSADAVCATDSATVAYGDLWKLTARLAPSSGFTGGADGAEHGSVRFSNLPEATWTDARGALSLLVRRGVAGRLQIAGRLRLQDGWSEPVVVKELDGSFTSAAFPMLSPDGRRLQFAAQGEASLGGYDVFACQYDENLQRFGAPVNIGMPYNSPDNDLFCIKDGEQGLTLLATDRRQAPGCVAVYTLRPSGRTPRPVKSSPATEEELTDGTPD